MDKANFICVPENTYISDDLHLNNPLLVKKELPEPEDFVEQKNEEDDSPGVDSMEADTAIKDEYSDVDNTNDVPNGEDLFNSGPSSATCNSDGNQDGELNPIGNIDWKAAMEKHSLTDPLLPSMNVPLHCILCAKQFSDRMDLQIHLEMHFNENNTFHCDVCGRKLLNKRTLASHMKLHLERLVSCDQCDKKFHHKKDLIRHARVHTGEKPFQCGICQKNFHDKSTLNCHVRVHTGEKPFGCQICSKSFSQKASLRSHNRLHTDERPYECGLCKKTFHDGSTLRRHTRAHTGEKPFQCGICQKYFYDKSTLNCHIRVHTGIKPFQCHICSKNFTQRVSLRSHIRLHNEEKPYECFVCKKNFHDNPTLKRHSRVHTGEKPFKCSICVKSFTQKVNLRNHLKLHTDEQLSQLHQCVICKERFTDHFILIAHMRIHIPEGTSPHKTHSKGFANTGTEEQQPTYKCEVCKEDVSDIYSMIWHIRVHASRRLMLTNTLPKSSAPIDVPPPVTDPQERFQCDLCAVSFGDRASFLSHWKTHSFEEQSSPSVMHSQTKSSENTEPNELLPVSDTDNDNQLYQCDVCDMNFANKISLVIHCSSHNLEMQSKDETSPTISVETADREGPSKESVEEVPFNIDLCNDQNTNMLTLLRKANPNNLELGQKDEFCLERTPKSAIVENTYKSPVKNEVDQLHIHNTDSTDNRISPVRLNRQTQAIENLCAENVEHSLKQKSDVFQCSICKETVANSYALLLHLKTHIQGIQQRDSLLSETVSQNVPTEPAIEENREEQTLQCNFCKDKFTDKTAFFIHLSKHIQGILHQGSLYSGIPSTGSTIEHTIEMNADQQLFRCNFCNENFTDNYSLLLHLRSHTEVIEERDSFVPKSSLLNPSAILAALRKNVKAQAAYNVSNESFTNTPNYLKPIGKPVAERSSPDAFAFVNSVKAEPEDDVGCQHRCTLCVQSFRDESALQDHLRLHKYATVDDDRVANPSIATDAALQPYTCEICAKNFGKKGALVSHMKAHRKRFQCSICPESFSVKTAFANHCSLHTGAKPYQCFVCKKSFARMGFLRKHLQRHSTATGVANESPVDSAGNSDQRRGLLNLNLSHSIFN